MPQNAKQKPKVFYGMHFYPGVAQYTGPDDRILVTENSIRRMEKTFSGCPVFVDHIHGPVDYSEAEREADGWVIESFFNKADGKHWVKFIVTSDKGHEALAKGYRLSNAYHPTLFGPGGEWNAVPYQREVTDGEFEHLALVENPRYDESVILSPEEFLSYNNERLAEIVRVDNSNGSAKPKGGAKMGKFSLFKRTPVETDADALVRLSDGSEMTVEQLVSKFEETRNQAAVKNEDDAPETQPTPGVLGSNSKSEDEEGDKPSLADLEKHHVQVNGALMSVGDLLKSHAQMSDCMNTLAAHFAAMSKKNDKTEPVPAPAPTENASPAAPKELTEEEEAEEFISGILGDTAPKAPVKGGHLEVLENAHLAADKSAAELAKDGPRLTGVALGKQRYGRSGGKGNN